MQTFLKVAFLAIGFALTYALAPAQWSEVTGPNPVMAQTSRKSVTVSASNETEARATAERQNPGWRAVSARKDFPDNPQSRFWTVVLEK